MVPAPRSKPRPATVLALDELDEGVTEFDVTVDAAALDLQLADFEVVAPVAMSISVGRSMQMFNIRARVQTAVRGECCRCLAPAQADVEAKIRFLLQRKEGSEEEYEALEEEDDVDLVDPGAKEFDLTERLRDAVILELPMRLYCKADCKGLCAQCGADLNAGDCGCAGETTDPRWEALAQLKNPTAADPSGV